MEAGTSTAPETDIFDRIGDFVGNSVRDGARRFVDHATVFSPLVAATRALTDPEGTKASFQRVGKDALDAVSILNPGFGLLRFFTGTETGKKMAEAGAKGAVDAATLTSPLFAAGRAVVDPEGTKKTFEGAGQAIKDYVESPLTGYGLAKRGVELIKAHPEEAKKVADVAFDIATITNPLVAMGRGIASIFD